ncbi:MAG: NUDIX hydrolase [Gemmatimonadales bacterium]
MLIDSTPVHTGRVIKLSVDRVRFPDGSEGQLDMIRHPGAAAVVPMLDRVTDADPRVLLIRQFRHAAGDFIWEIPAGTLGPGEAPEHCAARELIEEAGYSAGQLEYLTNILVAPGYTDERIHLFLATELSPAAAQPEADEFISVHEFRWSEIGRMIRRRELVDGKSLAALTFVNGFLRS